MEEIKISVRSLVEFLLRSGDIDNRMGGTNQKDAMDAGTRIHKKIQKQLQKKLGTSYQAEVPLKMEFSKKNYVLIVEGRADGILQEEGVVCIDEIKGVFQDVSTMEAPIDVHLAQAKCYAAIYAMEHSLWQIQVRMTYCNLESEEVRYFTQEYSGRSLEEWFFDLIHEYEKWADFKYMAKQERQASIANLEFPFPYREGQKDLAAGVYRTIYHKKNLFIQAPTGTGKTLSTVFPAIKGVGEGMAEQIFYLTARGVTQVVAREAYELLRKYGYSGSVLTITAKEKLCLLKAEDPDAKVDCNPEACPYAKGHYDRVNGAMFEILHKAKDINREALLEQARESEVCPFEFCLDCSLWVDNIVCDYNYLFDPNGYLKRFFGDNVKGDYIFLVDEAHNLVDRGREMYSASLFKEDFLMAKKFFQTHSKKITRELQKCNKILLEMKRECEGYQELEGIPSLAYLFMNLVTILEEFFGKMGKGGKSVALDEKIWEFYFNLRHFVNMYGVMSEDYVTYSELEQDGRFLLKLFCVNPAGNLQRCLDKGRSSVLFSATLLPLPYYMGLLSSKEDNYAMYAHSVFSSDQRLLLLASDVSSKYTRRNESEFKRIAGYILETAKAKHGNYMAFFPSYTMMEQVLDQFIDLDENIDYIVQESGMNEVKREIFLQEFDIERENSLVGFCVMGGIFAEGIDLKQEKLIGAIVVGTGLPQISNERKMLKRYYDEKKPGTGFDYAFRYPGMNKVQQAAGRVIRTANDRGVILLLDERFLHREYLEIFPKEWEDFQVCNIRNVREKLEGFWN